jgi:hypothetical protein
MVKYYHKGSLCDSTLAYRENTNARILLPKLFTKEV